MNAIYSVSEEDLANKAGQYTIKMTGVKVTKGADETWFRVNCLCRSLFLDHWWFEDLYHYEGFH